MAFLFIRNILPQPQLRGARAGTRPAPTLGLLFLLTVARAASAQTPVPNDDLAGRLPLQLGQPRESRTDGCTVEWACVDEKLTGRLTTSGARALLSNFAARLVF